MDADIAFWKHLALFLADCHAATFFHEGSLKSCSKSSRRRYKNICAIALHAMRHHELTSGPAEADVLKRLEEVVENY